MLSDWYFCTALRLPPQQTAAHLELLRVLRDGQQPAEVVGDDVLTEAIRMLAEAGPWRILHALPVALAAQQARQDPQITEAVTGCCTEMLDSCVRSSRPRDWLYDLLRRLLDGASSGDLAADLADRAERLLGGHPVTAPATPYLDLVEQAVPTIVLIVLDALSRRDPAAVRHWCLEDNRPLWLTRVLDGNYGRQALLLAVTVIARVGDKKAHAFLEAPSVGLADLEPDLMACYARSWLGPGTKSTGRRQPLDKLEAAAVMASPRPQPGRGGYPEPEEQVEVIREDVCRRLSGQVGAPLELTPVLWHLVLWEMAAEYDPEDCAARLARWWGAPPEEHEAPSGAGEPQLVVMLPGSGAGRQHRLLTRMLHRRGRQARDVSRARARFHDQGTPRADRQWRAFQVRLEPGPASDTDPAVGATIWSPWAYRRNDFLPRSTRQPDKSLDQTLFPALEPVSIVQLCAAAVLAVRLLRLRAAGQPPQPHLLALLMHAKDVLRDYRFRLILDSFRNEADADVATIAAGTLIPQHLHGLLLHLNGVLDNVGKGVFAQIEPADLTSFLLERGKAPRAGARAQERLLFGRPGLAIAVQWIREVTAGHGQVTSPARPSERWFSAAPGALPPVWRILTAAIDEHHDRPPTEAAALLQQLYPIQFAQLRDDHPGWNWLARRPALERSSQRPSQLISSHPVLDANAIVCAPSYTFDQWKDVSPLVGEWLEAPSRDALTVARYEQARTAMLVTRLSVLLGETADPGGLIEEWIQAYLNRVRAIAFRTELAREVRAQMVSLFPVRDPDFRYPSSFTRDRQAQLERVLSAAIDAIVGFSWGAPRYLLLLLDRLVQTSLPEALAGDLRHRFMRAVFQHRWTTDPRLLRQGPVGRVQYRVETRELDRALSRFVTNMASTRLAHLDATLGETFVTLWHDMHTDPRPSPEERPLDSVSRLASSQPGGMRAWNYATVLDRYRDLEIAYPVPVDLGRAAAPAPDEVESYFDSPPPAAGVTRTLALGVVCGIEVGGAGGDELVLNCGLGEPLRMSVDVGYSAEVGDLRAVRLSRAGGAAGWTVQNVLELRPPRPAAGERRIALVRPLPEFPWLRVEIDGEDVYPAGGTYDAALIRAAWDPDISRGFREAGPQSPAPAATGIAVLARYDEETGGWLPADRDLTQLLAEPGGQGPVELTYAGQVPGELGTERWRLATRPGHSYLFTPDDWTEPSAVREQLAGDPAGLRLLAEIDRDAGTLILVRGPDGRLADDRNLQWREMFSDPAAEYDAMPTDRGWVTTIVPPPGFPAQIPVDGLPASGDRNLFFEVETWGEEDWRRGRVRGAQLSARGLTDPTNASIRRLRELSSIQPDQVVQLEGMIHFSPDRSVIVRGPGGLTLNVEPESLTLLPLSQRYRPDVRGRRATVVSVRFDRDGGRQPATPLADDELGDAFVRSSAGAGRNVPDLAQHDTLSGAIVNRLRLSHGGNAGARFGVWLEVDGEAWYLEVPESAFEVRPRYPGTGDLLTVRRTVGGWVFAAGRRSIRVRARYDLVDAAEITGKRWETVGYEVDGPEIVQHPRRPMLVSRPGDARNRSRFEHNLSRYTVNPVGKPFGPGGSSQLVSLVRDSGRESTFLAGYTTAYDPHEQVASAHGVRLRVTHLDTGQVEVRREFLCTFQPRPPALDPDQTEIDRFRRREQQGESLVMTGAITSGGLRLETAARRPDGSYDRLVPQVSADRPFIERDPADPYPEDRIRALLVPAGQGYQASCRAAPALTLRGLRGQLGAAIPGRREHYYRMPPQFGYVGSSLSDDGGTVHVFEWGHGWTVEVPDGQLSRVGYAGQPLALFHGDHIRGATLTPGEHLVMGITAADVIPGLPARLLGEARNYVVHELEVDVDPAARTAKVNTVLTQSEDVSYQLRPRQARRLRVPLSAHLEESSLELLLASVRSHGTRRIFARLDRAFFDDEQGSRGRRLRFVYVPTTPSQGDGPGLRRGDRVFLLSGDMRLSADRNDVFVEFSTQADSNRDCELLKAEVGRRGYSHRQDLLPRLYALRRDGQPTESQLLLVTLLDEPTKAGGAWRGETKWSVPRDQRKLASFLDAKGASCLAAVAVTADGESQLEIEPGVVFSARDLRLHADVQAGAVVRLVLGHDGIRVELAIPSDLSYVADDEEGRAVVILPKSPLLRPDSLTRLAAGDSPGGVRGYTVAGLPGAEASAPPSLSADLLRRPHPKTVRVRRKGSQVVISDPGPDLAVGQLIVDGQESTPVLWPLPGQAVRPDSGTGGQAEPLSIEWAQLGYADAGTQEQAENSARRTFRYSDATTGHWMTEGAEDTWMLARPTSLEGLRGADEVVFAACRGGAPTLRYRPEYMPRFGFPADHALAVIEDAHTPAERTFSVAGVARGSAGPRGLWVELRPGHVSEITGEILNDSAGRSVSQLCWEHFAPGDRIRLGARQPSPLGIPTIRLENWRPGPRGGFGLDSPDHRVLLPVMSQSGEAGSLTLGFGRCRLLYPAGPAVRKAFRLGDNAWLTGANDLVADVGKLARDNVVLLGAREGRLVVHGLSRARPELAAPGICWPDPWLRNILDDEIQRDQFLRLLGGALAVTVEDSRERPDGALSVVVSRRRQPGGPVPAGSLLWPRFLGVLASQRGYRYILDSGGALYALPAGILIPGMPADLAPEAALKDARVWIYADAKGRLHGGRPPADDGQDRDILVIGRRALETAAGVAGLMCEEKESSAYSWLPADQAGWSRLSTADLKAHLTDREFRAARRDDGTISLTESTDMRRLFDRLTLGSTVQLDYLGSAAGPGPGGLTRVHLSEAIVHLRGVPAGQLSAGDSVLAEVTQRRHGHPPDVQVVPLGRRRIVVDLPADMMSAMRRLAGWEPAYDGQAVVPELSRFGLYQPGADGTTSTQEKTEQAGVLLVRAVHDLLKERLRDNGGRLPAGGEAGRILDRWWDEAGAALLDEAQPCPEVDLAPALAACLLLDARGSAQAVWAKRAVMLTHRLACHAERSVHTEALARSWLGQPGMWREPGAWERLRRLFRPLGQDGADPRGLQDPGPVYDFARTVLDRTDPREPGTASVPFQSPLAPVARSLLAAIGALKTGEYLRKDAPLLTRLAGLGRGLTPGSGHVVAQQELLACQRAELFSLFLQVTSEMIPLVLLPPTDRRSATFVGEELRATRPAVGQASPPAPSAPPQVPSAPARLPAVDGPAAGRHQAQDHQEVQLDVEREAAEREAAVQSASSADDMLRALVTSARSGQPVSVRLADLHGIAEHCTLAFVIGLVNSLPGCLCEPDGETLRVVPPSPPRLTRRTATGQMRRYAVTDISGAYTAPTTMLILGDAVQVDMSRAQSADSDKITYYFAGLAAGLGVSLKAGRSVLTVG